MSEILLEAERSTRKNKLKTLCKKLFWWQKESSEIKNEVEDGEN